MQQADRNLAFALLRYSQLHCLQYVVDTQRTTDDSDPSQDILEKLFYSNSAEDETDIDTFQPEVYASEYYTATLHSPVMGHINLMLKDARFLCSFIIAYNNSRANLQPLDSAISAASTGIKGRAPDNIKISVKVHLWRQLAINDYSIEQQLFKAYIRSLRFEKHNGWDATYVRIQYECGVPAGPGNVVVGFVHINYFFVYDDGHKSHMLANIDIISTVSVNAQLVWNIAPVYGGACGRASVDHGSTNHGGSHGPHRTATVRFVAWRTAKRPATARFGFLANRTTNRAVPRHGFSNRRGPPLFATVRHGSSVDLPLFFTTQFC